MERVELMRAPLMKSTITFACTSPEDQIPIHEPVFEFLRQLRQN